MKIEVQGNPSEEEVAAIIAAIELTWPKPAIGITARPAQDTSWRYSGRWWQDGRLPPRW